MRSSCTRLHPNAFDKDTNYFHTIQERYSSCFLYAESNVFPSLSFHKVHPFKDRPMQKSEAILGLGKILSEAIVPLRSTGLFRIILFRKAANQVGHLPENLFRTEKFNLLTHPQNPLVEVERRPQKVGKYRMILLGFNLLLRFMQRLGAQVAALLPTGESASGVSPLHG